ncbi:MAG: L-fuculose-phosphate aldolase [Tissierellia bacterium]|nr:L-fuculose-phosphate aldolase [Tissierellia bacterium]
MLMEKQRQQIVEYSRKLTTENLTSGTGGNISIIDRNTNTFAISPSGIDYFKMKKEDVVVINLDGKVIEGDRKPSSEFEMHRLIYKNKDDAKAIVHCHSTYATSLSINRMDLPASHYIVADLGGCDVKCAKYETYGTKEIALSALDALKERYACLLANHGQIAYTDTIEKAFDRAITVEWLSKLYIISSQISKPFILDDEEMDKIVKKFQNYGQKK